MVAGGWVVVFAWGNHERGVLGLGGVLRLALVADVSVESLVVVGLVGHLGWYRSRGQRVGVGDG